MGHGPHEQKAPMTPLTHPPKQSISCHRTCPTNNYNKYTSQMARSPLPLGLLYVVAFFSCGVPSVFAECPLSQWQNWQPVNLTTDSKPNDLAVQALKDYIQGLEQTAPDIRCPWSNATAHVETACMHVEVCYFL